MSALTAFATAESTFFDVVAGHAERNPDQPTLVALGFAPISYRYLLVRPRRRHKIMGLTSGSLSRVAQSRQSRRSQLPSTHVRA